MASRIQQLLPLIAQMHAGPAMSLSAASQFADMSPWHLQRIFAATVGESPTQYQRRLRLDRSAVELRSTDIRIIDAAFSAGFQSHEAFTRAFSSHFGISPSEYRKHAISLSAEAASRTIDHGRCVGLHHVSTTKKEHLMPTTALTHETIDETPAIIGRRRVDMEHISDAIGEILPAAYAYAMQQGLAMAGPPFVRYLSQSAAFAEIEAGVPLVDATGQVDHQDLFASTLPGGAAATAIHEGSYDTLGESHAVLDRWINDNGLTSAGGPWEIYLTDPGEIPDPKDWKTKIVWPLAD